MVTDTFSMALDDFRRIMAVNVEGTFLGMKHGVPIIADSGGGSVVNISSMAGLKGIAGMAAYCASKGAIRMRSEEHTSELQSLMRISYAVFCLTTKTTTTHQTSTHVTCT